MQFIFLLRESIQALRSNLLRSSLTVFGIVVGIFSVTAMLALGAGLSENVLGRFNSFAQGDLTVQGDVTPADLAWIRGERYVEYAVGTERITGATTVAFAKDYSPTIQAVLGDYKEVQSFTVTEGEVFDFNDADYSEQVALVSIAFADSVNEDSGRTVIGENIIINGQNYRVIGVIDSTSVTFTRGDGVVLVPYGAALGSLSSTKNFSSVAILLKDSSYFEVAGKSILATLNASRQLAADSDDTFTMETSQSFIETAEQTTQMISLFLGIIGGIALFVGGIGTMNMMLTTVTERTKEIGLRKAIGARDKDILSQILIESVTLTSFGGAVGILLSTLGAELANTLLAGNELIKVVMNIQVVILAFIVSFTVGIIFGVYPAFKASRLQPVDALRAA